MVVWGLGFKVYGLGFKGRSEYPACPGRSEIQYPACPGGGGGGGKANLVFPPPPRVEMLRFGFRV